MTELERLREECTRARADVEPRSKAGVAMDQMEALLTVLIVWANVQD